MVVPSVSQLIAGQGGDRCGEACLAACLQALAVNVTMLDIVGYLGKPTGHATSTLSELLNAAIHYRVHAQILNSGNDCITALREERYVIVLLNNALLSPRNYPPGDGWFGNHYIVWEEDSSPLLKAMDPLAYPGDQQVSLDRQSLLNAVHAVPIVPWGIAVWNDKSSKEVKSIKGPKVCH